MRRFALTFVLAMIAVAAFAQDVPDEKPRTDMRLHRADVHGLAFDPTSRFLISIGSEGDIKYWDLDTEKVVKTFEPRMKTVDASRFGRGAQQRYIESVAFSPDGKQIAEITAETTAAGTLRVWNVETGEEKIFDAAVKNPRAVAYSPDGRMLASNSRETDRADHKIILRDPATGTVLRTLKDNRLSASYLAFSPDGKWLASAGATRLLLWNTATWKVDHDIAGYTKAIEGIAFSPDSRMLAGASGDLVRLWRVADGKMIREWNLAQDGVKAIAYSPSGKTVATAGADRSVKLWNPDSGRRVKTLWAHADKVLALAFSPDGKTLASGGKDGMICLWNMDEASHKDQKDEAKPDDKKKESKKPAKKP